MSFGYYLRIVWQISDSMFFPCFDLLFDVLFDVLFDDPLFDLFDPLFSDNQI